MVNAESDSSNDESVDTSAESTNKQRSAESESRAIMNGHQDSEWPDVAKSSMLVTSPVTQVFRRPKPGQISPPSQQQYKVQNSPTNHSDSTPKIPPKPNHLPADSSQKPKQEATSKNRTLPQLPKEALKISPHGNKSNGEDYDNVERLDSPLTRKAEGHCKSANCLSTDESKVKWLRIPSWLTRRKGMSLQDSQIGESENQKNASELDKNRTSSCHNESKATQDNQASLSEPTEYEMDLCYADDMDELFRQLDEEKSRLKNDSKAVEPTIDRNSPTLPVNYNTSFRRSKSLDLALNHDDSPPEITNPSADVGQKSVRGGYRRCFPGRNYSKVSAKAANRMKTEKKCSHNLQSPISPEFKPKLSGIDGINTNKHRSDRTSAGSVNIFYGPIKPVFIPTYTEVVQVDSTKLYELELSAATTCIRQPRRIGPLWTYSFPRPVTKLESIDEASNASFTNQSITTSTVPQLNKSGSHQQGWKKSKRSPSLDLREAGLLDLREGEKLFLMGIYMEPRLLVRNVLGEYGLARLSEVKGAAEVYDCLPKEEQAALTVG